MEALKASGDLSDVVIVVMPAQKRVGCCQGRYRAPLSLLAPCWYPAEWIGSTLSKDQL